MHLKMKDLSDVKLAIKENMREGLGHLRAKIAKLESFRICQAGAHAQSALQVSSRVKVRAFSVGTVKRVSMQMSPV